MNWTNTILKKTDCTSEECYNDKIVSNVMNVLVKMKPINSNTGLYKKLNQKFLTLKDEFFTPTRFPELDRWKITHRAIYNYPDYNLAIYCITWGGAFECPFKKVIPSGNNSDNTYDGYDFGNRDIFIYNLNTKEHVVFNTWHIHAMCYHNNFGTGQYKLNTETLEKVLQSVPVLQIKVYCIKYLVYDNIFTMVHNQLTQLFDYKPNTVLIDNKFYLISAFVKSDKAEEEYNEFLDKNTLFKKKSGVPDFTKDLLYFAIVDKKKFEKLDASVDFKDIETNYMDINHINMIKAYMISNYKIFLDVDDALFKYGFINKCYPVNKDICGYEFNNI